MSGSRTINEKEVLTTGEVARICHVAPRTVSKWFDTGKLRGYRIPGSRDRRIPRSQLVAFMRANGIPMDTLEGADCRVLVIDSNPPEEIIGAMNESQRYKVRSAINGFEAGIVAQEFRPHVIVLDADIPEEAISICRDIKTTPRLELIKVIAALSDNASFDKANMLVNGFDGSLTKPYSLREIVEAVEEATNLIT